MTASGIGEIKTYFFTTKNSRYPKQIPRKNQWINCFLLLTEVEKILGIVHKGVNNYTIVQSNPLPFQDLMQPHQHFNVKEIFPHF